MKFEKKFFFCQWYFENVQKINGHLKIKFHRCPPRRFDCYRKMNNAPPSRSGDIAYALIDITPGPINILC